MTCTGESGCSCGCCAGVAVETPQGEDNRVGLSAIAYRTGVWGTFKNSMLARLSSADYPALAGLKTRDDDLFSIALLDASAMMLDVLTFYQERLANESYLRTATQLSSLTELSRLIGYRPSPGVAASTYLAFTIKAAPGAPADPTAAAVTIPAGTKAQSVPAQGQTPQTFETSRDILAKADWNALPVQTGLGWQPKSGDTSVYLVGTSTQLNPGDAILIVGDERANPPHTSENWDARSLAPGDTVALTQPPKVLQPDGSAPDWEGSSATLTLAVADSNDRTGTVAASLDDFTLVAASASDQTVQEFALVSSIATVNAPFPHTRLSLSAPLINCYDRASASANANVGPATAGASVTELVGSGSASTPDQKFTLKQAPLTYVSAPTPTGRKSTLTLRANGVAWTEAPTLYGQPPDARVFRTLNRPGGVTEIEFGDGVEGALLPTGQSNIMASYRIGLGAAGNVAAGAITTLVDRPLGASGVVNPLAASGGQDAQTVDDIRAGAPLTVITLGRAVSIADYQIIAETYAGIAKASAIWIPSGRYRGVFITVAAAGGEALPPESPTLANLVATLKKTTAIRTSRCFHNPSSRRSSASRPISRSTRLMRRARCARPPPRRSPAPTASQRAGSARASPATRSRRSSRACPASSRSMSSAYGRSPPAPPATSAARPSRSAPTTPGWPAR